MRLLAVAILSGCGLNASGAGAWTPLDQLAPPVVGEMSTMMPPSPFRAGHPVVSDPIRIVTYNTEITIDPLAIANAIETTPELAQAGVFLLQESEQYPGEQASRVKPLAEHLGLNYAYIPEWEMSPGHTQGLAVMSAYPIENVMRMDLPLAGPHRRASAAADIIVGDRVLHVITVHLELRTNAGQRLAQLRPAVIDAPATTVVAGDFNMVPAEWVDVGIPVLSGSDAVDQAPVVDAYMRSLHFDTPTQGSGPTSGAYGIYGRLDAIYTRGMDVAYGGVPHIGPSDHWPLWVDVKLL